MKTIVEKAKAYDEVVTKLSRFIQKGVDPLITRADAPDFFPELKQSEDGKMKETCKFFLNLQKINSPKSVSDIDKCIAWLEKQCENNTHINLPKFTFDDVLALQCCMETVKKVQEDKPLHEQLQSLHSRVYDAYHLEEQGA